MNAIAPINSPYPPRYWWLTRVSLAAILAAVLLAGFWFFVDHRATERVQRELADLHAQGEPTSAADFNQTPVADERNIVTCLKNAVSLHSSAFESPNSTSMIVPDSLPMSDEWITVARKAEAGNAVCLNALKPLNHLHEVDWHVSYRSPLMTILLPWLNDERELANLLSDMMMLHHLDGNDALALDEANQMLTIADAVSQQPFLICGLVGIGIDALTVTRLEVIAAGIGVKDSPGPATQPAERKQVQDLIARLLRGPSSMTHYFSGERVMEIDAAQVMGQNAPVLRPMMNQSISRVIDAWPTVLSAANETNLPVAQAKLRTSSNLSQVFPRVPWQGRAIETNARVTFEMRVAAIGLACRLYYLDHENWPNALQDLVPNYLPAVPNDPLAPQPQPIGFRMLGPVDRSRCRPAWATPG